jgi:hypothetical protein
MLRRRQGIQQVARLRNNRKKRQEKCPLKGKNEGKALMSHEDVLGFVRKRPFQPFRLFVSDGSAYDVRHPELIMLGRRSVAVGLTTDPSQTVYDRLATVDLLHIARVAPLEAATAAENAAAGQGG